ncbi:MAG: hypothetical protein ACXACG_15725 [Candidatus Thorarchaeota archaeon]|jgi:hypothetical protein
MEKPVFSVKPEETIPVTFLERIASRPTPVPTLYAIRQFCGELESALDTLLQSSELQVLFSERDKEKDEIHERLQRIMLRFQEFLMIDARR